MTDNYELLERENALLRTIIDSLAEGIYAVDEKETVILYNSSMEKSENMDRKDIIGRTETEVYDKLDGGAFNRTFNQKIFKTKTAITQAYFGWDMPDGKRTDSIVSVYPFFHEEGFCGTYLIGYSLDSLNEQIDKIREQQNMLLSLAGRRSYKYGLRYTLEDIVTQNPDMKEAISQAKRFATLDSPIMIIGPTGTGKELFAQGIHCAGTRPNGPFVSINCAAIPESLMESILFGTVKGAFTGASDMPGLFEQAEKGTLFLDEINSMPLSLQAKLLRVIQEKKVRRLGSGGERDTNCRIISATNIDPFSNNELNNNLRSDLFFRLAVIAIKLPSLKARPEDIFLLADHFIKKYNERHNTFIKGLAPEVNASFLEYSWPGNVRELGNIIESAMNFVCRNDDTLQIIHIPSYYRELLLQRKMSQITNSNQGSTLREILKNTERQVIVNALQSNNWNVTKAAETLGILRQNLNHKIKEYHLSRP